METFYFLGIALGGGLLSLFLSAGWSSFKHKKIPEKDILFRWFVAGLVAAGLLAYAWIFGSGGDVGEVMNRLGGALELSAIAGLTAATVGNEETVKDEKEKREELQIGMPKF